MALAFGLGVGLAATSAWAQQSDFLFGSDDCPWLDPDCGKSDGDGGVSLPRPASWECMENSGTAGPIGSGPATDETIVVDGTEPCVKVYVPGEDGNGGGAAGSFPAGAPAGGSSTNSGGQSDDPRRKTTPIACRDAGFYWNEQAKACYESECVSDCSETRNTDKLESLKAFDQCTTKDAPGVADHLCSHGYQPCWGCTLYPSPREMRSVCKPVPEEPTCFPDIIGPCMPCEPKFVTSKVRQACQLDPALRPDGTYEQCLREIQYPADCYAELMQNHVDLKAAAHVSQKAALGLPGAGLTIQTHWEEGLIQACRDENAQRVEAIDKTFATCERQCE